MTDQNQDAKTVDQLQDEIQKLKDKNTQLLNEKRNAQTQRDELADKLTSAEKQFGEVSARLDYLTIQLPRDEIIKAAGMPESADLLWRELTHHFDVVRTDDGRDVIQYKAGKPLEIDGKPVELTVDGLGKIFSSGALPALGRLLKSSGASGGGALGGARTHINSTPHPATAKAGGFGLR